MRKLICSAIASILLTACASAPSLKAKEPTSPKPITVKYNNAIGTEVPTDPDSTKNIDGHPVTSIVVTQCNLIVVVYLTMNNGQLVRFDKSSGLSADQLLAMAYTADRSQRTEVDCHSTGVVGYEDHKNNTL